MTNTPFFSILIPLFNNESYVKDCIESILNQSEKDFECIICDDSSDDEGLEIAKKIISGDSRFFFFKVPHRGVSSVRNFLLSKSRGNYIVWVDPDDYINKNLLELAKNKFIKLKIDVLIFNYISVFPKNKFIESKLSYSEGFVSKENIFKGLAEEWTLPSQLWNKIINRSVYNNLKFADNVVLFEDFLIMPNLMNNASTFYYMADYLYFYRRHCNSLISSKSIDKELLQLKLRKDRVFFFKDWDRTYLESAIKSWLISYYRTLCLINILNRKKSLDNSELRSLFFGMMIISSNKGINLGIKYKLLQLIDTPLGMCILPKFYPFLIRFKSLVCRIFL